MAERAELIIDAYDIDDEDILFITPDHIKSVRFLASNIFDHASIKHCPTEKLNAGCLIGIFNSLKPGAEISIVVNQPISVMLEYDSKQIEANLKLVGFEDIKYEERKSTDEKAGYGLIEGILTAIKPINKEKDIEVEIIKSEKQYTYKKIDEKKKEKEDKGRYMKKVEKMEENKEEFPSKYKKGRFTNNNEEKQVNEDNTYQRKKYNRYSKKEEEEPKEEMVEKEVIIKEEKRIRPKRFGINKAEEEPKVIEHKTEKIITREGKPGEETTTTKEVVIEKTSVTDKKADLENKKAGLRKRYGKH